MKHLYRRNLMRHRRRRLTAAQLRAQAAYGVPLPLQPRRPLRGLAGHPLFGGRVLLITPELLRAYPEVYRPYIDWVMSQADRWIWDRRVSLDAISRTWKARWDYRAERLREVGQTLLSATCGGGISAAGRLLEAAATSFCESPRIPLTYTYLRV